MTSALHFTQADYLSVNPPTCTFPVIGYDCKVHDCGAPGVRGTEGGWCAEHGIISELHALQMDKVEMRPEYQMSASEIDFTMEQLAKYQAASCEAQQ